MNDLIPGRAVCERCRHPRPVHEDKLGRCRAPGCTAGDPDRAPCPGFVYGGMIVATGMAWPPELPEDPPQYPPWNPGIMRDPLRDIRQHHLGISGDTETILDIIEKADRWLDGAVSPEYQAQPLAQDWARVCKETEEQGESIAELILATGQNPRKGTDPDARERLLAELADRAVTGLLAIQHFTKDTEHTWHVLLTALAKTHDRVPARYGGPVG